MSYEVQQHILSGYRTMSRGTLYIGCMSPFVVAGLTLMDTLVGMTGSLAVLLLDPA